MPRRLVLVFLAGVAVGAAVGVLASRSCTPQAGGRLTALSDVDVGEYAVSHILVAKNPRRSPESARILAQQAYELLLAGEDFASVAEGRSEDGSAARGGFLGFMRASEDNTFSGILLGLHPGLITPPVRTPAGWQIVKRHTFEEGCALERRFWIPAHGLFISWEGLGGAAPGTANGRTEADARGLAEDLVAELRAGQTDLTRAMKQYVAPKYHRAGAFIAMVSAEDRLAPLHAALEPLSPGQYADPFVTEHGWAVLRRGRHLRAVFRHILVQHLGVEGRDIRISRTKAEALEVAKTVLAEALEDRSRWDDLVAKFTDDIGSRANHGRMADVLTPATIPIGLETVIHDIDIGTIHPQVAESVLGYHILWRVR